MVTTLHSIKISCLFFPFHDADLCGPHTDTIHCFTTPSHPDVFPLQYDTGRLRPGGRASSRQPQDRPKQQKPKGPTGPSSTDEDYPLLSRFRYDHAAQFITTATTGTETLATLLWRTDFDRQVQRWIDRDILMEAPNNSMYVFEQRHNNNKSNNNDYEWTVNCLNPDSSSSLSDSSNTKNEVVQKPTAVRFCYPTGGMSSLVDALIEDGDDNNNTNNDDSSDRRRGSKKKNFVIKQDVWVSPSSGVRYTNNDNNNGRQSTGSTNAGCWTVRAEGKTLGHYDHLIIAHNGKCADRLMSKSPAKDVHKLLRTNFNDRVPKTGGQKMTLNSIYSLTLCVQKGVISNLLAPMLRNEPSSSSPSGGFVGAFIQNHPQLGSVICQTNKYPRITYSSSNNENENDDVEVWTILSTASFAKRNKAPQEFLPNDVIQDVTRILVDAFEHDILLQQSSSDDDDAVKLSLRNQILESRLQLWGAAVPLNVWRGSSGSENNDSNAGTAAAPGFIHDPRYQVGVCGDWLLEPSIAGAWTSGRRLAHHLLNDDTTDNHRKETDGVGFLNGYFEASESVRQLGLASLDGPMNSSSNNQTRNLSSPLSNHKKENGRRTDQKNGSNENTNTKKKRMNHQGKKQTEQNQNRKANNSSQQLKKKRIGT